MVTREQRVQYGHRIHEFLHDDAVNAVLSKMERAYYEEFKIAASSEQRVTAWAKAKVLDDFQHALLGMVDDGTLATAELEMIAKEAESRRTGRPLPHE